MRISLLGKKIGMTQIRSGSNTIPATLVEIVDHDVFGLKTLEKDGYNAIIFSAGDIKKEKNTAKPLLVQFKKLDLQPKERLFEVRIESRSTLKSFEKINNDIFDGLEERFVDVSGITIGKGFAGAMKRWNFAGLEASHGVSVSHRSHGSTGQRQDPGRVFKGKKMAGHLGDTNNTVQNLQIVSVDKELKVVAVRGAIPGHKNSYVFINDSIKMGRLQSFTRVNNINLIF
jgi:large subunit ribosomal protein L3